MPIYKQTVSTLKKALARSGAGMEKNMIITTKEAYIHALQKARESRLLMLLQLVGKFYEERFLVVLPNAAENLTLSLHIQREEFKNFITRNMTETVRDDNDTVSQMMVFFFAYITGVPVLYDGGKNGEWIGNPLTAEEVFNATLKRDCITVELGNIDKGLYIPQDMTIPEDFG